ncbi:MAG TPA: hypothetical protein VK893_00215 [Pyrinomonadaceae bacterium]|nr:hypothetical protein [Pyrinomonadaceae bacterium]
MPKDATKNVDRYKVRGGHLNEYEYQQDKAADKKQTATNKEQLDNEQAATPKQKVDKSKPPENPKH